MKKFNLILITFVFFFLTELKLLSEESFFELKADKILYKKKNQLIIADGNAIAWDNLGRKITSNKIIYDKHNKIITTYKNSKYTDKKTKIHADKFIYNINNKIIEAKNNVIFFDKENNEFKFSYLKYYENDEKIIANNAEATLQDSSTIISKNGNINLKSKISELYDVNYTPCEKIYNEENIFCPTWSLKSKKLIHDKNKKKIIHKNSFLRIKNIPVLYTPYFSHPDPSVKRQSGFLMPTTKSISNLGKTINTPYYWAISEDKDLTFEPIHYFSENNLYKSSYRQKFKKGYLQLENGYTSGYEDRNQTNRTPGSRNYFFAEYNSINDENKLLKNIETKLKIQKVSQENFLRVHKINTKLFKEDIRNLESFLNISGNLDENKYLNIKVGTIENLDSENKQKYTYLFPEGSFSLNKKFTNEYNFNLYSTFVGKKFLDNQKQVKINNDLQLIANERIFKKTGIGSTLKFNLLNNNIYNDNVLNKKNNDSINNFFTVVLDNQFPLAKYSTNKLEMITPRFFAKYTTGKTGNNKESDNYLNYEDIYSINRSNTLDNPETGLSFGHGFEYDYNLKENKRNYLKTNFAIGQVFRDSSEPNMPTKSSLNNKSSDIAGKLNFSLIGKENNISFDNKKIKFYDYFKENKLDISYNYNLNNDFKTFNRNVLEINTTYKSFNFFSKFTEYKNHIGNEKNITSGAKKLLGENYFFNYEGKINMETNKSEYHNLGIFYENDCIQAGFSLNKNFYYDKDYRDDKTIIFSIIFKPFSDSISPDISNFFN